MSAPGCILIITSNCLLLGVGLSLKALPIVFLGKVLALVIKMLLISPVLPGTQGDYREERLRIKGTDTKWREGCQGLSPAFG
jgi:hypothetical protein